MLGELKLDRNMEIYGLGNYGFALVPQYNQTQATSPSAITFSPSNTTTYSLTNILHSTQLYSQSTYSGSTDSMLLSDATSSSPFKQLGTKSLIPDNLVI